jgi:hypothetical protein
MDKSSTIRATQYNKIVANPSEKLIKSLLIPPSPPKCMKVAPLLEINHVTKSLPNPPTKWIKAQSLLQTKSLETPPPKWIKPPALETDNVIPSLQTPPHQNG